MSRKTLLLTIGIIIISAGPAVLVWYWIFSPTPKTIQPGSITLPTQAPGKIKQLSSTPVLWASISTSQNKIFWYDQSGQLWSSALDGSSVQKSVQAPIQNFIKSIWSADSLKNIIETGTSQKDVRFISLASASAVSTFLPNNIKSIVFSPDSKKVTYQIIDDGKNLNTLSTSDPDGKKLKTVLALKLRDVIISWPQTNLIGFVSKPTGLSGGNLWVLNLKTLVFDKLIDNLNGLEILWSPDGSRVLFSSADTNGQNPHLGVLDLKGNARDLGISTITSKCAWALNNRDIYCAAPRDWAQNIVLPDDYYKNDFSTTDDIGKINTDTGQKNLVIASIIDATNLAVSPSQDFLILTTKNNGHLYLFDLK